jgi:LPXTG-motif cell wall-anchored protein
MIAHPILIIAALLLASFGLLAYGKRNEKQ